MSLEGNYLEGVIKITNLFVSLFVLLFAASFLSKTRHNKDRNPWVFLFFAVIVFFVMQVANVLDLVGFIDSNPFRYYFDSMFLAIVLFTFIFQYNLILNSELIMIKKDSKLQKQ